MSDGPTPRRNSKIPNPTNAVGGSFKLNLHARSADFSPEFQNPKSHQRSWWIVQAQPTRDRPTFCRNSKIPNPTNAVGGSFKLNLHERWADSSPEFQNPKSHQRSWWIVQAQPTRGGSNRSSRNSKIPNPTNAVGGSFRLNLHERSADSSSQLHSQIPPTQLVDRSSSTYMSDRPTPPRNYIPKSHQRSWWIVQAQPTRAIGRLLAGIPKSHQRSWWIVQAQPLTS
jgi:hypothetical protein